MAKKKNPVVTYVCVVLLLVAIFALMNPWQFREIMDELVRNFILFSKPIIVLIIIALVVLVLKYWEKI